MSILPMDADILPPADDRIFKVLLTHPDAKRVLIDVVSTINESGGKRANFLNKYTYYMTDLHSSQKSKGKEYSELVRTYQVTFCSHSVFNEQIERCAKETRRKTDSVREMVVIFQIRAGTCTKKTYQ